MVVESIRIARCTDAFFALCREHGLRARDPLGRRPPPRRSDDVAAGLGAGHRRPHDLEETVQGCELKRESWLGLAAGLEADGRWTEAQQSLALDLLGVRPELRDAETPVDPAIGDALAARRSVVAAEVSRLTRLVDRLAASDELASRLAEATLGSVELTRPLQLMQRYERAAAPRPAASGSLGVPRRWPSPPLGLRKCLCPQGPTGPAGTTTPRHSRGGRRRRSAPEAAEQVR